jgi:hypothetical protein
VTNDQQYRSVLLTVTILIKRGIHKPEFATAEGRSSIGAHRRLSFSSTTTLVRCFFRPLCILAVRRKEWILVVSLALCVCCDEHMLCTSRIPAAETYQDPLFTLEDPDLLSPSARRDVFRG